MTISVATNICAACGHGREEHRFPDEGDRHDTNTACEEKHCICGEYCEKRVPRVPLTPSQQQRADWATATRRSTTRT